LIEGTPPDLNVLETPRLRLRGTRLADIPALIALWTDPEVTRYMGGPRGEAALREGLIRAADDPLAEVYDLWPLEEKATGQVIGHCGLIRKQIEGTDEVELVYVVARGRWRRGYGSEIAEALKRHAFDTFELDRIVSLIDPENIASQRVAEKIGMRLEKEVVRREATSGDCSSSAASSRLADIECANRGNCADRGSYLGSGKG
jgi:ribosomal-protein-alanine N-acetyltransferase